MNTLVNLLVFLVGLLAGHYLTLYRDKRKERNDAIVPIRDWLLSLKESPERQGSNYPTTLQWDRFFASIKPDRASQMQRHLDEFHQARMNATIQDQTNGYRSMPDSSLVDKKIEQMLELATWQQT